MSKKWSSYDKDGQIMESWRNYVDGPAAYKFLQEGPDYVLTEEDLQELFGKRNWEKLVDRFAVEDDGAADLAQRLGLKAAEVTGAQGQALDVAEIEAKIRQVMDIARKSNDPELANAAQNLAQNAQQVAQGASAEEATADDAQGGAKGGQNQAPTPVDVEEVPDAPAQGARDIKISASSRYGDATTLEDIAIQMLGLPARPDPNKDKQQNRAVQKLTAKIMQAVKKALQNEFGSSLGAVQTTYENNQAEIKKLFIEELHKSRK